MEKIYKIQRSDGLFSTGGISPDFNKVGKVWKQIGHLKSHIAQIVSYGSYSNIGTRMALAYKDCEIAEYEIIKVATMNITDMIVNKQEQHKKRIEEREQYRREARKAQLKKELKELENV